MGDRCGRVEKRVNYIHATTATLILHFATKMTYLSQRPLFLAKLGLRLLSQGLPLVNCHAEVNSTIPIMMLPAPVIDAIGVVIKTPPLATPRHQSKKIQEAIP